MQTIEKVGGRPAGSGREKGEVIPLVARLLFRSSPLTGEPGTRYFRSGIIFISWIRQANLLRHFVNAKKLIKTSFERVKDDFQSVLRTLESLFAFFVSC